MEGLEDCHEMVEPDGRLLIWKVAFVHTGRLNNATNDLNISSFRAGLYLVRILRNGTIIKSVKIIKQ